MVDSFQWRIQNERPGPRDPKQLTTANNRDVGTREYKLQHSKLITRRLCKKSRFYSLYNIINCWPLYWYPLTCQKSFPPNECEATHLWLRNTTVQQLICDKMNETQEGHRSLMLSSSQFLLAASFILIICRKKSLFESSWLEVIENEKSLSENVIFKEYGWMTK